MDFNLKHLRSFIVVARTGNLSTAAKELDMTQPYLGRQMASLEKEVNLVLFLRHSRGLCLTKQGKEFLDLCQDIVGKWSQGTERIREQNSVPEGGFNFLSGAGLLETIMENIVLFSQKFPSVSLNFSTIINVYQLIINASKLQIGEADASVMPELMCDANFIQYPLYRNPMRIYASPQYLRSHPMPKSLEDLESHQIIVFGGKKQEVLNKPITDVGTENFLHPFIEVGTTPAMRTALIHGAGIGCYGYNQKIMDKELLIDVFPQMPDHDVSYYYTYHKRLEGSPKVEAFYDFLKEITKVWERP